MSQISAVIITKNEERNIGRCLESLEDVADEIIVVDSGSTDRTEFLCKGCNTVRFYHHDWAGYSEQKNYAESLAKFDWILSIDADEAPSHTLRTSLKRLKARGCEEGMVYSMNRLTNYCGHWIWHCGWYPDEKVRLWQKGRARWDGVVHEELRFEGEPQKVLLQGNLLHYSYYSVEDHQKRLEKYAKLAAEKARQQGRKASWLTIACKPIWRFIRGYFIKGGIRDGRAGFTVCKMEARYVKRREQILQETPYEK